MYDVHRPQNFFVKSSREKDGRGDAKAGKLEKKNTNEGTVFIDDVDFVCWLTDFCYPMLFAQDKLEF